MFEVLYFLGSKKGLKAAEKKTNKEKVKNLSAVKYHLKNCQSAVKEATPGSPHFMPPCCYSTSSLSEN